MGKLILYFDSFGPVEQVLREVEIKVPLLFGEGCEPWIALLEDKVRQHAEENKWDLISLSLSKGLARQDLDDLIESQAAYRGPIVVDPTASTPEHQVFRHRNEVKSCRERLVRVNESMDDVLVILYGIEAMSREREAILAMRRLRMAQCTLDLMAEEGLESYGLDQLKFTLLSEAQKLVLLVQKILSRFLSSAPKSELRNVIDTEGNAINLNLVLLYTTLYTIGLYARDIELRRNMESLLHSIAALPKNFPGLGLDFQPRHAMNHESHAPKPVLEPE